jgi:hypothetical protein
MNSKGIESPFYKAISAIGVQNFVNEILVSTEISLLTVEDEYYENSDTISQNNNNNNSRDNYNYDYADNSDDDDDDNINNNAGAVSKSDVYIETLQQTLLDDRSMYDKIPELPKPKKVSSLATLCINKISIMLEEKVPVLESIDKYQINNNTYTQAIFAVALITVNYLQRVSMQIKLKLIRNRKKNSKKKKDRNDQDLVFLLRLMILYGSSALDDSDKKKLKQYDDKKENSSLYSSRKLQKLVAKECITLGTNYIACAFAFEETKQKIIDIIQVKLSEKRKKAHNSEEDEFSDIIQVLTHRASTVVEQNKNSHSNLQIEKNEEANIITKNMLGCYDLDSYEKTKSGLILDDRVDMWIFPKHSTLLNDYHELYLERKGIEKDNIFIDKKSIWRSIWNEKCNSGEIDISEYDSLDAKSSIEVHLDKQPQVIEQVITDDEFEEIEKKKQEIKKLQELKKKQDQIKKMKEAKKQEQLKKKQQSQNKKGKKK